MFRYLSLGMLYKPGNPNQLDQLFTSSNIFLQKAYDFIDSFCSYKVGEVTDSMTDAILAKRPKVRTSWNAILNSIPLKVFLLMFLRQTLCLNWEFNHQLLALHASLLLYPLQAWELGYNSFIFLVPRILLIWEILPSISNDGELERTTKLEVLTLIF